MKGPWTWLVIALMTLLVFSSTAPAGIEVPDDDALSHLLRRPAGSAWITGEAAGPLWIRDVDGALPLGVIGQVHRTPNSDRLELTRTTIGIATTGRIVGRPLDTFGMTATLVSEPESIRFPASIAEEDKVFLGLHHEWTLGTDVHLRSSFGWRTGREPFEPTVWAGVGLRLEF